LLDPSFRRDIENAANLQQNQWANIEKLNLREDIHVLRSHVNEAILVLMEAGVDGEFALEAVREVEQALGEFEFSLHKINPEEFFWRLRNAKVTVCKLADDLAAQFEAERRSFQLRRLALAGAGLVLVGAAASGLGVIFGPAAAAAGAGAIGVGVVAQAVMQTIGATIFQHYTAPTT
jgi:hypothetical protein